MLESKRAARRRHAYRIARRRLRLGRWLWCGLGGDRVVDLPDTRLGYFTANFERHRCGKRKRGRPKTGYGACYPFLREAGRARILSRRLTRDLTAGRIDPDDVLPSRGFHGIVTVTHRTASTPPR